MRKTPWLGVVVLGASVLAQQSTSYTISNHTFNAGGHPAAGAVLTSTSYRVSLDAVGEGAVDTGLLSASYRMDASFVSAYPPAVEVLGVRFSDVESVCWEPLGSIGAHNLYRDLLTSLSGLGYGECEQYDMPGQCMTDDDPVPLGNGFFYLVTVENRLGEEGTKGWHSDGPERPNPNPCP